MTDKFLSQKDVLVVIGNKSRATLWRWWAKDGIFPKPKQTGPHSIGWLESEIQEWIESRKAAS